MDTSSAAFLFLPMAVQGAFIGLLCGALALAFLLILKVKPLSPVFLSVLAGVMAIGILIGLVGINAAKPNALPKVIKAAMLEQRLFQVLEKHHPTVFQRILNDVTGRLTKGSQVDLSEDAVGAATLAAISKSVPQVLDEAIITATNPQVIKLMAVERDILETLREKDPEGCSDYVAGKSGTWAESLSPEEIKALSDARADVIESAAVTPTERRSMSPQAIARVLAAPGGLTMSQLQTFANANVASPREICSATLALHKVIRGLGPVEGPRVYVAITRLGNTE